MANVVCGHRVFQSGPRQYAWCCNSCIMHHRSKGDDTRSNTERCRRSECGEQHLQVVETVEGEQSAICKATVPSTLTLPRPHKCVHKCLKRATEALQQETHDAPAGSRGSRGRAPSPGPAAPLPAPSSGSQTPATVTAFNHQIIHDWKRVCRSLPCPQV